MEIVSLSSAAKNIIVGFKNSNDNSGVFENWKCLISNLNQYTSYSEIPYLPDVPLAMYKYVMKFSSKRMEENSLRVITTFGVLMNAIEHTQGTERLNYLALVASLVAKNKKHFNNANNYSIFPITVPQVKEYYNQIITDYGNTTDYFDSIFLYIYNNVILDNQSFWGDEEIRSMFISNKESFFNEYNQKQHCLEMILDGAHVLQDCYSRMNQVGKCPIFIPSASNTEIYNKTYGLIPNGQTFNVSSFYLHETSGIMSEGETNFQIKIDIHEGMINISCEGINEQYLKSNLILPISEIFVMKIRQHIELNFDNSMAYQDSSYKYGNMDNVPTSMDLHFEHFKLTQIVLTFIVGEQGWMRKLQLNGKCS